MIFINKGTKWLAAGLGAVVLICGGSFFYQKQHFNRNIEINGVERIFDRNIIFDLPLKGELYEKGLGSNPVKTISRFLGDKGELFCISPLQYVSICNATSHNYARRVQRGSAPVCPICNAI